MPLYIVETLHTFRHRYVIDCKELEHAFDTVIMEANNDQLIEYSQKHLGDQIIDGREITLDEFHAMNEKMKDSVEELSNSHLGESVIYRVVYPKESE